MREVGHPVVKYRDTAAHLAADNGVFESGALVVESDTGLAKWADGHTGYVALPYSHSSVAGLNVVLSSTVGTVTASSGILGVLPVTNLAADPPVAAITLGSSTSPGLKAAAGPRGVLRASVQVVGFTGTGTPTLGLAVFTSPDGSDNSWHAVAGSGTLTGLTAPGTVRSVFAGLDKFVAIVPTLTGDANRSQVSRLVVDATSGAFPLVVDGHDLGSQAFNVAAAAVQTAVRAISAAYNAATVTGGPGSSGGGTPYMFTFANDHSVHTVTSGAGSLAGGGASSTPSVTTTALSAPTATVHVAAELV